MANFNIVVAGFGLQAVRILQYSAGQALLSRELEQGEVNFSSYEGDGLTAPNVSYAVETADVAAHLHGGSKDSNLLSWMGTPIFADLRFERVNADPLQLDTVLIDVSQTKNIVTTAVQGRNGTIKEYVSDGDYVINIKGAITTPQSSAYPTGAVRDLLTILKQPAALSIISDYLRIFDIYQIVVTDYRFSQSEGFTNVQFFEINCISDTPDYLIQKL
jgi:hypothetical protein